MNYTYQLVNYNDKLACIKRSDGWAIPIASDNVDYQRFKLDIAGLSKDENGNLIPAIELQDSTGTVMTAEQVSEFLATIE